MCLFDLLWLHSLVSMLCRCSRAQIRLNGSLMMRTIHNCIMESLFVTIITTADFHPWRTALLTFYHRKPHPHCTFISHRCVLANIEMRTPISRTLSQFARTSRAITLCCTFHFMMHDFIRC